MQLMQMILLSTFVGSLAYTLVERPDVREGFMGGIFVVLLGAVAVMLLSLGG